MVVVDIVLPTAALTKLSCKSKYAVKPTPRSTSTFGLYKTYSYSFAYSIVSKHNTEPTAAEGRVASSPSGCSPFRCEANVATAVVSDKGVGRVVIRRTQT